MSSRALFFFALLAFSAVSCFAENEEDPGLVMDFYKDSCPQAEDVIREQVKLLYKRHKNTAFSWLRNIFHDCAVQLGGPFIPLKTGRRDGRRSRAEILEQYLPDHNESMSTVLEKFADMGIDTPGLVALLGAHSVGRTHCVKLCTVCTQKLTLSSTLTINILDNKGLMMVDHQLATDKRTKPYVKKMAKSQDYFFKEFSRAFTILSENNPLTGTKGEIRQQCNVANKIHN
ncbi:heme peroxidase plant/fungal/bacterial [Prunus yedoensis var. nudiflora]|uniref:peroxidase n=1 Tax=Prunus yedoensis var. nudiflora TaxID=2094558 RepID=A0A314ZMC6_PRUYE|nr:heme peroxidase plant/fungal/bacterial [Prunus yedoensis var. nudiflora]